MSPGSAISIGVKHNSAIDRAFFPLNVGVIRQHGKLEKLPADLEALKLSEVRTLHKQLVDKYHSLTPSKLSRDDLDAKAGWGVQE